MTPHPGHPLTLAQAPRPAPLADPPPLPPAPIFARLILESPIPTALVLIVAAIVGFLILNQRGRFRAGSLLAAALGLAAAIVLVLGSTVVTERERLTHTSEQLVDAVATANIAAVDRLLSDDVRMFSRLGVGEVSTPPEGLGKQAILDLISRLIGGAWAIKEHSVLESQATLDAPTLGRTQIRVRVVTENYGVPNASWWRLDWRKAPDGAWRIIQIEPLDMGNAGR